ncbi:MAG: YggS family pyridoxal phosphate-dependent enzyme [Caldimonas sp.]
MIADKLAQVHARIASACMAAGRPVQSVTLLAVSKTFDVEAIAAAHAAGQRRFGENYVQEAVEKVAALDRLDPRPEWHLIGPLQSNKTRVVAATFDWVHTVDRLKIAERLSAQRPEGLAPLSICLQVNVSGEATKSGLAPGEVGAVAHAVATLPRLRLRGLMAIPEVVAGEDVTAQRRPFRVLRMLFDQLRTAGFALDTLSAGMSEDLEAAILEGSTMVRVGSAIFGRRPPA